jgi:PEGA domain
MRWSLIICSSLGFASAAAGDPADAHAKYRAAQQLVADGDNEKALTLVDEGLALAPKDLQLLEVRGSLLLKTRDYEAALAAYQAYIAAGPTGANRRAALKIVASLDAVKSSFIDIAVANGPATVYLDTRSQGAFCTAAPGCTKGLLPGEYKAIVERSGFERFNARVTVELAHTARLAVTLIEKSSALTITTTPAGAEIAIDGKPVTPTIAGGDHELVISAEHFATGRVKLAAHEGQPVSLQVALVPLVPITIPRGAELVLDGQPIAVEQGGLAIPTGAHELVARAAGFHDTHIAIAADRASDFKLEVALQPIGALVDVTGAPAGSKLVVDGQTIATTPLAAPVEVAPGPHRIELRAGGYLPYRDHSAFTGNQAVHLQLSHLRPESRRWTRWSALATGVGLAVGGVTSWLALDRHSQYDARARLPGVTQDDPMLQSLKSDGSHFALAADLGLGVALIGAVATTYFFLHEGRGESEGSLQLGVGLGAASISGRF